MSYLPYDKYRDVLNYAKKMLAGNPLPFSLPEMTEVEALVDADERSMVMFERANKLEAELAELKERYRWRVQGKENAPDWECILYITKNKEVRMDVGRGLEDGERWMPLPDLPKEANP